MYIRYGVTVQAEQDGSLPRQKENNKLFIHHSVLVLGLFNINLDMTSTLSRHAANPKSGTATPPPPLSSIKPNSLSLPH